MSCLGGLSIMSLSWRQTDYEWECCLLVLNLVSSTLPSWVWYQKKIHVGLVKLTTHEFCANYTQPCLGRTNKIMAMWLTAQGNTPPYEASVWIPALADFVALWFEPDPYRRARAQDLRTDALLGATMHIKTNMNSVSRQCFRASIRKRGRMKKKHMSTCWQF